MLRVEYSATIARSLGVVEEEYDSHPGETLATLCVEIRSRHGEAAEGVLYGVGGALLPAVIAAVNDAQAAPDADLRDGDRVMFLSAVGGG